MTSTVSVVWSHRVFVRWNPLHSYPSSRDQIATQDFSVLILAFVMSKTQTLETCQSAATSLVRSAINIMCTPTNAYLCCFSTAPTLTPTSVAINNTYQPTAVGYQDKGFGYQKPTTAATSMPSPYAKAIARSSSKAKKSTSISCIQYVTTRYHHHSHVFECYSRIIPAL